MGGNNIHLISVTTAQ